jgi:hypothetical protein
VLLEVCEGDWNLISKEEINFAGSFSRFLGRIMRIHMWPEGIDDEVLHVG